MISWLIWKLAKDRPSVKAAETCLSGLEKDLNDLRLVFTHDSEYFRFSRLDPVKERVLQIKRQVRTLKSLPLKKRIRRLVRTIESFEEEIPSLREEANARFFQKEKGRTKRLFTDEQGNDLLTEEQLKAVLCNDDRNLIIAGAGSGKTRVIDFKVRYLVASKGISPSRILLLSFSKKSASDLAQKITERIPGVEVRTIHSFASQMIEKQNRKFFDDGHNELESFIIKALAQALKEPPIFGAFSAFYEKFFSDVKPLIFYENLNDLRADLRKLNSKLIDVPDRFGEIKARRALKTLRGDYVRSIDERYIADFFYLHDIKYEYERRYPNSEEPYYPDFYLPDHDVYLEHFAITSSGQPPAYFHNPQRYMEGILWKRALHREKKTRMIESYSYLLNGGATAAYLRELLVQYGITAQGYLEKDNSYKLISRELCRIFTKFYHTYKLSGLTLTEPKRKYVEPRYFLFLQVFESFFLRLEETVSKEKKIDFNDLIIEAVARYNEAPIRTYDYIIVDEFQDTSNLAMKLLDQVFKGHPHTTFLSVGDDWQSIYGFNGSDVTILSDYTNRYPGVSIQNLNSNFRSHAKIVELGKKFISKNPAQIPKEVISQNESFKNSEIGFLSLEQMERKIRSIPDGEPVLILYRYNDDGPVAVEMFKDLFMLDKYRKPVRRSNCKKNISMMTIHASKGLEAQHVFILFPDGVRRKFPSEIEDHFVFNMLKTHSEDYPFSEERRLMYVAITRAEQNLYFVASNNDPNSVFWDELRELAGRIQ